MASISLAPASAVGVPQASYSTTNSLAKSPARSHNSSTLHSNFNGLHCAHKMAMGSARSTDSSLKLKQVVRERVGRGKSGVVCAVGDVSSDGTTYLIAGAIAIAVIGTALPFIFSRKDTCPECGGAGFVRGVNGGGALRANAARKDQQQIVCKTCNGLGKIGQTDKV